MRSVIPLVLLPLLTSATLRPFPRSGVADVAASSSGGALVQALVPSEQAVLDEHWGWGPGPGRAGYAHWPSQHPAAATRKRHPQFLPPVARFRSDNMAQLSGSSSGAGIYRNQPDISDSSLEEASQKSPDYPAPLDEYDAAEVKDSGKMSLKELLHELVRLREERERYNPLLPSPALMRYGILP